VRGMWGGAGWRCGSGVGGGGGGGGIAGRGSRGGRRAGGPALLGGWPGLAAIGLWGGGGRFAFDTSALACPSIVRPLTALEALDAFTGRTPTTSVQARAHSLVRPCWDAACCCSSPSGSPPGAIAAALTPRDSGQTTPTTTAPPPPSCRGRPAEPERGAREVNRTVDAEGAEPAVVRARGRRPPQPRRARAVRPMWSSWTARAASTRSDSSTPARFKLLSSRIPGRSRSASRRRGKERSAGSFVSSAVISGAGGSSATP
jgi:hypothetical protein